MKKYFLSAILLPLSLFTLTGANPYLPLWEHIPDGEPYVFEDPDQPGLYRVYIYGSHDVFKSSYCGPDQVVWSAPVDDLLHWRYDGIAFKYGEDVLFAPDVALVVDPESGKKTYYLYPNNQVGGRQSMVCKSERPDGPFLPCNWIPGKPGCTEGILGFDPAVFVDDDGRVYGYWGFGTSHVAELDPATMATVKPGTEIIENMISGYQQPGEFRFFEASSMRKIKDKYVFIYSRVTADGEEGLPSSNYTLAYAYSDSPTGPFTYGGTLIDCRAGLTANPNGNTHGSICEINGQWYVFYHRQTGTNEYSRQAMVSPIEVSVTEGPGGKVEISRAEYTSEGFETEGLNPLERHSAGITCYYTGPGTATEVYPNYFFPGSYVKACYPEWDGQCDAYDLRVNHNPVINNTAGSVVGYKYFNFSKLRRWYSFLRKPRLHVTLLPQGVDGRILVKADDPENGLLLGEIALKADAPQELTELSTRLSKTRKLKGKHALFFVFESATEGQSLCELHDFIFTR